MIRESRVADDVVETVIEIGAEGGSLTVLRRAGDPPSFALKCRDQSLVFIDEGDELLTQSEWCDWQAVMQLLERYPWRRLYPLEVHQDCARAVWDLVAAQAAEIGGNRLDRWAEACRVPSELRAIASDQHPA